ncbi:SMP-30/gluconolactonase/LRE family protein [Cupriavidus taiwanensis]|uniref:SMP-30/gluconolactonase/LRE family protein n=1 Tax=Cupriavidus taiwanensis TaxID=164546 RepID=UPI000E189FB1|nr:SMP-30/gluconolactonase/LRE family protein [Cupriavidus taiwanensis]SOZ28162.1 SMP-30/Gluconolaconase/LRE domain protein [Cupriavidus taiwanensis]SPA32601.1 SMP-30/Gluconolaconase/LRE domain protein [Cupriavidus taiwanensis]
MNSIQPVCIWPLSAELGEGPLWHGAECAVYFVDIKGRNIHRYCTATGAKQSWTVPCQPGFIAALTDKSFLCGLQDGLYSFDPVAGHCLRLVEVEPDLPGNRINDGFVDPYGRLWFGTMDDAETAASGSLYQMGEFGKLSRRDEGYVITNGPAMSPDARTLYHADTVRRRVYAFDVGHDGVLSEKRIFARFSGSGYPDGMAVDADGFVWIALFGGARVERWSPDGMLAGVVQFPCANVTKLAFGGDDLRSVYVTTAWKGLSPEERERQPLAGGLFLFRAPASGLPQPAFSKVVSRRY